MHPLLRIALAGVILALIILFVTTTFVPPPAAEFERARQYFSEDEIATGLRYSFQRRLFFWAGTALEIGLLMALVATGAARRLADRFGLWVGYRGKPDAGGRTWKERTIAFARWLAVLALMGSTYIVLHELLQFPINVGRFYHNRAWELTERPFLDWLGEYGLALLVTAVIEAIAGVGLFLLLRWFPRTWYLLGTAGVAALAFLFAFLQPVLIAPLFNTFTPLSESQFARDPKWAGFEDKVRTLTAKAGLTIDKVYVADASRQGTHTNAYFSGLGATQSIVLYDTLLKEHPPDEVESILGHEIGHWIHRHIINGILLGALAALVGLIVLDRILHWFIGRAPVYLSRLSDPAGLPLILLLGTLGAWVVAPVENAVSRHFERQADAASLNLAGMPREFIAAEKRLVRVNKSNVVPTSWNVWLFATHPSAVDRIEMAKGWRE
jgi:STE24 endopeptidase